MSTPITIQPGIYRHYENGHEYRTDGRVGMGKRGAFSGTKAVIYYPLVSEPSDPPFYFTGPRNFSGNVRVDGERVKRFTFVRPLNEDFGIG